MIKNKIKFDNNDKLLIKKFFDEGYESFTGFEQSRWLVMNIYNKEFKEAFEKEYKKRDADIKDLRGKLNNIYNELYKK